jgi:hypothetical protein
MILRTLLGYLLAAAAVVVTVGGIWAARYYSPGRIYARQLREKRRRKRDAAASDADTSDEDDLRLQR